MAGSVFSSRCVRAFCWAILLGALAWLGAAPATAAVTPGDYCLSGLGGSTGSTTDGWVGVVTPAPVASFTDLTAQLTAQALIDPYDCAIDPTNGDIIVVDEGDDGSGTDGSIHRISVTGGTVTAHTVLHNGAPLVNPHGVAVGQDGAIYVGDAGPQVYNNAFDGAVYGLPAGGSLARLDVPAGAIRDAFDVDIDPKPFTGTNPGVNLVILDGRGGQFRRVLLGGSSIVNLPAAMGGNDWESFEVGPLGNYFAVRDGNDLERYDRLTGTNTSIQNGGGPLDDPFGVTVDYYTGDLVVADADDGVINVPPGAYIGGAPGPTTVLGAGALPPDPAGIGFSPPLASADPSTNFGMPTRRAPIPGALWTQHGAGTSVQNGDVEQRQDIFIEVTDTSSPLLIRIYDANIRDGFDSQAGGGFASATTFTLLDPSGGTVTSVTIPANGRVDLDQRIATLNGGNTLTVRGPGIDLAALGLATGLYQLVVTVNNSDDFSVWGLWVDDFHSYSYSTVYGALNTFTGPNPQLTPLDPANLYPYFDRGCEYTGSNWDLDVPFRAATLTATTRLGSTQLLTGSNNNQHLEDNIDPAALAGAAPNVHLDYGIHSLASVLSVAQNENNIVTMRFPDFQGWVDGGGTGVPIPVPPGNPAANPTPALRWSPSPAFPPPPAPPATGPNSFLRQYLPRYDEAPGPLGAPASPYAPYLIHSATPLGNDPPTFPVPPNLASYYAVQVTLVNPDPVNALDATVIQAPVPAPTLYVVNGLDGMGIPVVKGPATTTGGVGGAPFTCAAPCSGTIWGSWTSVPAASAVTLSYAVEVTPTAVGQRLYLTGGPARRGGGATPVANPAPTPGTQAFFVPAWQSLTFSRFESLGPLCDLSVVEGSVTPVAVELASFEARAGDGEVLVSWETAAEFENLGFDVYRRLAGEAEASRVNPTLILGRGTTDLSARYALLDRGLANGVEAEYWLEDIEFDGTVTRHGPVAATPEAGAAPLTVDAEAFASVTIPGEGDGGETTPAGAEATGSASGDASPGHASPDSSIPTAGGPTPDPGRLQVLERGAHHLTVEIEIPPLQIDPASLDGEPQLRVSIPGWEGSTRPGWPELPARSFWIEDAPAGTPSVRVLERDGTSRSLVAPVLPVLVVAGASPDSTATSPEPAPDPIAYASDAPYPTEPAVLAGRVGASGAGQHLALLVQPARYRAASGGLESDARLLLRIEFEPEEPVNAASAGPSGAAAAALPGVKITTRGAGRVRVTAEELMAAGLDPETDPRFLRLLRQGRELAVRLEGGADGRLDAGDALEFWAEGYEDRYTDEDVYFLVEAEVPGLRAGVQQAVPGPSAVVTDTAAEARQEEQILYLPGVLNGEGDNFVGAFVFDQPVELAVATPAALAEPASLSVRLRGGTSYAGVPEDHHFALRVEGSEVLDVRFDGPELYEASVAIPSGLLGGDAARVEIVPLFDSGAPFDLIYVDAVEIVHRRRLALTPDESELHFVAELDAVHAVAGLAEPASAAVWDVTDPGTPVVLGGVAAFGDAVLFEARAGHRYTVSAQPAPAVALATNRPSAWSAEGGAEWLAVAHGSLIEGLAPLVALRESQGLRTAVVDVEDVYDEFGGGRFTPEAIRDFVQHARARWQPAPRYLLLVGDASYDYRDHLGGTASNRVPTMLLDTTFVEAASDGWFGAAAGESAPALAVGRLPADDPDELAATLTKLVAYETAPPEAEAWRQRLLLVADDGAGAGNPAEAERFEATLDAFTNRAPGGFEVRRLALSALPEPQGEAANASIRETLGEGAALAVYVGHGGARLWAEELIFGADDFATLVNPRWPLFVVLNCLNAFFDAPNEESLAEIALQADDRGAIAFISSTTVSALPGQTALAEALATRLLAANERRVGDAFLQALQGIAAREGTSDVLRAFVLIGDPATRLVLPEVPTAEAGLDRTADAFTEVLLDGSASRAPAGEPLRYAWRVVDGPEGEPPGLLDAETVRPRFQAITPGRYRVELVVRDERFASAPDAVVIDVLPAPLFGCGENPEGAASARLGPELLILLLPLLLSRPLVRLPSSGRRGRCRASASPRVSAPREVAR